jgi:hypothetical protein
MYRIKYNTLSGRESNNKSSAKKLFCRLGMSADRHGCNLSIELLPVANKIYCIAINGAV